MIAAGDRIAGESMRGADGAVLGRRVEATIAVRGDVGVRAVRASGLWTSRLCGAAQGGSSVEAAGAVGRVVEATIAIEGDVGVGAARGWPRRLRPWDAAW